MPCLNSAQIHPNESLISSPSSFLNPHPQRAGYFPNSLSCKDPVTCGTECRPTHPSGPVEPHPGPPASLCPNTSTGPTVPSPESGWRHDETRQSGSPKARFSRTRLDSAVLALIADAAIVGVVLSELMSIWPGPKDKGAKTLMGLWGPPFSEELLEQMDSLSSSLYSTADRYDDDAPAELLPRSPASMALPRGAGFPLEAVVLLPIPRPAPGSLP